MRLFYQALLASGLPKLGESAETAPGGGGDLEINIKPDGNKIWLLNTALPWHDDVAPRLLIIKINDAEATTGTIYRANLTQAAFTSNLYSLVPMPQPLILTSTHFLNFALYSVGAAKVFSLYWSYFEIDPNELDWY